MGLLLASILLASISGISRFKTESRAAVEFDRLARDHILRNQEIARGIERRIAGGQEKEIIPPPFGSRAPNYVYTWCHPAVVLPPGPLQWMTMGDSDLHPAIYSGPGMTAAAVNSNPLLLGSGYFDLTQVIVQILPIVLILLTFDLALGEADAGTLALTLAQPVTFRRYLLLSSLPAAVVVVGTTVLSIGGSAVVSGTADLPRLGLWLGSAVVYGIFWLALILLVNAARFSSSGAASILAGVWLVLNVLIPTAANAVASALHPMPSRTEYVAIERGVGEQLAKRTVEETVRNYRRRHSDYGNLAHLDGQGYRYVVSHALADARDSILDAAESGIQEQRANQEHLATILTIGSPATVLTRFMTEIAGTGDHRRQDFLFQKNEHLKEYARFFRPRIYRLPASVFQSSDYYSIPQFQYREESLARIWPRAAMDGCLLTAFVLLAGAVVAYRLR